MSAQPTRFYLGQPGVANTTLLTVGSYTVLLKQILVSNVITLTADLTLSIVPQGDVPRPANQILSSIPYDGNSITLHDLTQVLTVGDSIVAVQSTASALTVCISGLVF